MFGFVLFKIFKFGYVKSKFRLNYLVGPGARNAGKPLNASPQFNVLVCSVEILQAVLDVGCNSRKGDVTEYHSWTTHTIIFVVLEAQQTKFLLENHKSQL
jgi:hypothetical protein